MDNASHDSFPASSGIKAPRWVIIAIVGVVVMIFVALIALYGRPALLKLSSAQSSVSQAAIVSTTFALVAALLLIILAFATRDTESVRLFLTSGVTGATIGWGLGMYFSPQGSPEQQAFAGVKTAVVGVLSGYILSKLQRLFDKYMDQAGSPSPRFVYAAAYFLSAMLLSGVAVYNVRAYKELRVIITQSDLDSAAIVTEGNVERLKVPQSKIIHFHAEARFPEDTSVRWSIDPPSVGEIGTDGTYKAPADLSRIQGSTLAVVATSNADPKISDRLNLRIVESAVPIPVAISSQKSP